MPADTSDRKPFAIQNADGDTVRIPPGQYYFNTKARCQRLMANSLSADARRAYAFLELCTMGWQRETAVMQERLPDGRLITRPTAPADVRHATGLSKENTHRAIVELERQGLVRRYPIDGGTLRNGNVGLLSWAEPREPENEKRESSATPFPSWLPPSWAPIFPLIRRLKISLPEEPGVALDSHLIEEGEGVAQAYEQALKAVVALVERVSAAETHIRKERTERTTTERTHTPCAPKGSVPEVPSAQPQPRSAPVSGAPVNPPKQQSEPAPATRPETRPETPPSPPQGRPIAASPPEHPPPSPATALMRVFDPSPSWNAFWQIYTGHEWGKDAEPGKAKEWWFSNVTSEESVQEILIGLNRHIQSDEWSRGIGIPRATRFLDEHWYRRNPRPRQPNKRDQVQDQLMQWAAARDLAKEKKNGGSG